MARTANQLNMLIACFLPLTTVAAVMGMNIASGLHEKSPTIFYGLVGLGLVVGVAMAVVIRGSFSALHKNQRANKTLRKSLTKR